MQGTSFDSVIRWLRAGAGLALVSLLIGCGGIIPEQRPISSGHLSTATKPPAAIAEIPEPVRQTPVVPAPVPAPPVETYTVVVNDVPVKELLFALARDASVNVDIHPDVSGRVTLNAIDQSLEQILNRVSRQMDLRYEVRDENISIRPDTPFVRIYRVDYVNLSREATTSSSVSTNIQSTSGSALEGGGGGGNNSNTTVTSTTSYPFWETLVESIRNLLAGSLTGREDVVELEEEEAVIANPANGVLMVRATARQHEEVQAYLDEVHASAQRQVLIEATIVEVQLADEYTAGIDWSSLAKSAGTTVSQSLITGGVAADLSSSPFFLLEYADARDAAGIPSGDLSATVRLLKEFGDTRVLSSPKLMALNNQTALLKVVENVVYFQIEQETIVGSGGSPGTQAISSTPQQVSVGVVMSVTPQINSNDEVILTVRPTISRVIDEVPDPNPLLTTVPNFVPEISVREMESVLRIGSGQLAVLGGLMQDDIRKGEESVPLLSESEAVGDLFTSRNNQFVKTELVIFLRPWVIRTPDVRADLNSFEQFLPENLEDGKPTQSRWGKKLP